MKDDIAIKVDSVSKQFSLPHEKTSSVKGAFLNIFNKNNKTYETQRALKDISFEVKEGEFFGIVGRNGSGKSTLLKIIAGIYQPTKGNVNINGRLVPFIELGVGFNPELTGRENVYLNGALLGFSQKEIKRKYHSIVEFAELAKFMDQKLKNYSSGMQVRLAFSVATILADSDILLIDEVLAVGDADFQRKCFRYFRELKKNKKTVVFVSHDMNAVREYCDKALLIEKQEIIASGEPEIISKKYEKLLQPKSDNIKVNTVNEKEWGDRTLQLKKPKVTLDKLNDTLEIGINVFARNDREDPMVGFVMLSGSGTPIFGTNTMLEKKKIGRMLRGEEKKIIWKLGNILSDGEYYVTFAAHYDNGTTTAHWWEEALVFSVKKDAHIPYSIYPKYDVIIKNI